MNNKICIDARMYCHSGIGTYIRTLLNEIKDRRDFTLILPSSPLSDDLAGFEKITSDVGIYSIDEQLKLPGVVKGSGCSLLHIPHYNIPLAYKGLLITTIHDLIHLKFPEFHRSQAARIYSEFLIKQAAKKSDKIITDSFSTKNDILEMLRVPEEKVAVIPLGVNITSTCNIGNEGISAVKSKFDIRKPYLLYVGNVRPHKNINRLIEAFKILNHHKRYQLVIAGAQAKSYNIENTEDVVLTGFVFDEELECLYKGAELFVFPSLYEGFGIPPLEAMARGVSVACSNTSSLPEVVGQAAVMFDPYNVSDIAEKLKYVLESGEIRSKLIDAGKKQVLKFSTVAFADKTLEVYRSIL